MESKKVLLICADGCEDIETISQIDVLTRAGIPLTIATANGKNTGQGLTVKGAYGTTFLANEYLEDCEKNIYDMITLPGGLKAAEIFSTNPLVIKMLCDQKANNRWYCAICASPALVFQPNGLLDNEVGTCYPAFWEKLSNQTKVKERVVVSNKCITSQAAGTSLDYGLALVKALVGEEKANEIAGKMLAPSL